MYATYLDLERRGIIREVSKTDVQAFELVKGVDLSRLKRHEIVLTDMIAAGVFTLPGRNNIADSQLFAGEVDAVITERLQLKMRSSTSHALSIVRLAGLLLAVGCSVWILMTATILHVVFGMLFGRLWTFGREARKLWFETEGYRQYLKQAELGRLKFESEDVAIRAKKDRYAYAVALGLDMPVDTKA